MKFFLAISLLFNIISTYLLLKPTKAIINNSKVLTDTISTISSEDNKVENNNDTDFVLNKSSTFTPKTKIVKKSYNLDNNITFDFKRYFDYETDDIEVLDLPIEFESGIRQAISEYITKKNEEFSNSDTEYCNCYSILPTSDLNYLVINLTVKTKKDGYIKYKPVTKRIKITWDRSPDLIINESDKLTLPQYSDYIEKGAIAVDKEDGDISNLIYIEGEFELDTSIPGTYYIKYSVTDSANHEVIKYKTIIIEKQ